LLLLRQVYEQLIHKMDTKIKKSVKTLCINQ
jgi:hypothetical protein